MSSTNGPPQAGEQGFTLVEVMIALSISIVVLLANIYLINTTNKSNAQASAISAATNLATSKIADFRAMTIVQINAAAPAFQPPCPPSATPYTLNPLNRRQGSDISTVDGVQFTRTWVVSDVDLDHNGTSSDTDVDQNGVPDSECDDTPDMVGDVVKIVLDVTWLPQHIKISTTNQNKGLHHIKMATFVTGRPQ